jgi:hypothetical protein
VKRLSVYVFTSAFACAASVGLATVARHRFPVVDGNVSNENGAAYRDGLFLGRLDAEGGRKPHLTSGRWSAEVDRRLFVSGYLEAYGEMYSRATSEHAGASRMAGQKGYRDGVTDGLQQRLGSKRFQASATENYRRADRGYSEGSGDLDQYERSYREAYCNGYQEGYYGEPEKIEIETANFIQSGKPE